MLVRILDFNVWDENPKPAMEIVDFIFSHDADIVCLQEVREDVLRELIVRGVYHLEFARGTESESLGTSFLVILSKLGVKKHGVIRNTHTHSSASFFRWWKRIKEHLESHFVLINTKNVSLQVFNMHLPVFSGPLARIRQFRKIIKRRQAGYLHIIAGDFNIYADRWYHKFIGWLFLGHSNSDLLVDERDSFENIFKEHKLRNIFRGRTTYSLMMKMLLFQFDHIIIPDTIADHVSRAYVCKDSGGSDHKPIIVELDI